MPDLEFQRRVERALRAAVPSSVHARRAIMDRVRQEPVATAPRRLPPLSSGRSARHSLIGIALAAGIGSITTVASLGPAARVARTGGTVTSVVIGDSVVDRLRDTLRLVRLMFDDPTARQVAVVGDFNGWRSEATPMRRDDATGRWAVTLALHAGAHRYAIVVDNTRWAGDAPSRPGDSTRQLYSLLHVARASN
ncbi:hypothetical protein BH11GEM1_BH11GEM1_08800 [soil metagenome]